MIGGSGREGQNDGRRDQSRDVVHDPRCCRDDRVMDQIQRIRDRPQEDERAMRAEATVQLGLGERGDQQSDRGGEENSVRPDQHQEEWQRRSERHDERRLPLSDEDGRENSEEELEIDRLEGEMVGTEQDG